MAAAAAYTGSSPTVRANPAFNAEEAAKALRKAMKGLGTDEAAIIDVLSSCNTAQRAQIKTQFKVMFGKDLIDDLKKELGGKFEDLVVALLMTPDEYDATCLRGAMKGAGTEEGTLIEILCTRSNAEIHLIKDAYKRLFSRDLEKDVMSETSGNLRRILVSCTTGARSETTAVDVAKARAEAVALQSAGVKKWGTDESEFNRVLMTNSPAMLREIDVEYSKITGYDLVRSIEKEMSGTTEKAFVAVVQTMRDPAAFFADKLYNSMIGAGTDDATLIRVVVSRVERDMGDIKKRFLDAHKKSLARMIKDDCSGDYKKLLVTLVGE